MSEALSSDEDEIDELSNSYLENLENFATQKANKTGLKMNSEIKVCVFSKEDFLILLFTPTIFLYCFSLYRKMMIQTQMTIPMMISMNLLWKVI